MINYILPFSCYIVLSSFLPLNMLTCVFMEEIAKYITILRAKKQNRNPFRFILFFSLVENILYGIAQHSFLGFIGLQIVRLLTATQIHLLCSFLFIKLLKDKKYFLSVSVPITVHYLYNFVLGLYNVYVVLVLTFGLGLLSLFLLNSKLYETKNKN